MEWVLLALIVWLSGEVDEELNWFTSVVAKGVAKMIIYAGMIFALLYLLA